MKLTVLMDNNTYIDQYYLGEPAVSYLIEDGERTILFDAGYSGAFIENAERMKIDLGRVTDIVLSHGHIDHTEAFPRSLSGFISPCGLRAHPNAFLPKQYEGLSAGSPISLCGLPDRVERWLTAKAVSISERVRFLGEIPCVYPFEENRAVGETLSACGCVGKATRCGTTHPLRCASLRGCLWSAAARTAAFAIPLPRQNGRRGRVALRVCSAGSTCSKREMR